MEEKKIIEEKANIIAKTIIFILTILIFIVIFYPSKEQDVCKYEGSIVIEKKYSSNGVFFNVMKNYKIINNVYLSVEDFSKYSVGDTIKCEKNNINIKR